MKRRPTSEEVINSFSRLSAAERNSLLWEVITSPEWIANSNETLREFREEGVADDEDLSFVISMLEKSSDIARYLYGKAADRKSVITLAEEIKFCRNLKPDEASKRELKILSRFLNRVKSATDSLDAEFFRDLGEAVELVREAQTPAGSREALYVSLLILQIYRSSDLEPTKADIKREVMRMQKLLGRKGGPEGGGATVSWQRDVWKHPELSLVKERIKGQAPVYLPEIYYQKNK